MSPGGNQTSSHRARSMALLAAALAFFLVCFVVKLRAPLTYWDSALLDWAASPVHSAPPAATSPFYILYLKLLAHLGWLGVSSARWFNAAGALLTAWVTLRLGARLSQNPEAGFISGLLYLSHPAVLQGMQSLDMTDISFFPAAFALWVLEFTAASAGWNRAARLAACGALAMGWKTTSSLGLLLYPVAAILLASGQKRKLIAFCRDLVSTVVGFMAFALAWWSFQTWDTFFSSRTTAFHDIGTRVFHAGLARIMLHSALGLVWLGPFLVLLGLFGAAILLRQPEARPKAIVVGTALYGVFYLVVGGMNHGFPRYHVAILPILCALCAKPLSHPGGAKNGKLHSGIFLFLTFVFWLYVQDPIYFLNVKAREAFITQSLSHDLLWEAPRWVAWLALPAMIKQLFQMPWQRILLVSAAASALALGIVQSSAPYVTSYGYGEEGRNAVVTLLSRNLAPGDSVVSPPDLSSELQKKGFQGPGHGSWGNREAMLDYIHAMHPRAIALGLTGNTEQQLNWLLKDPPPEFSSCRNRYMRIGTYWVCIIY